MKKTKAIESKQDFDNQLISPIIRGIEEKKGKNIRVFNLKGLKHAIVDYFVICNADSATQVDAIAYSVEGEVKKEIGESPWRSEGFTNAEWILVDYVDVVVHVFRSEARDFYRLDSLWADAEITEIAD